MHLSEIYRSFRWERDDVARKIIDADSNRIFNLSAIGATISNEKSSTTPESSSVLQTSLQSNIEWLTSWKFFNCWILLLSFFFHGWNSSRIYIYIFGEEDISRSFEKYNRWEERGQGEITSQVFLRCSFRERNRFSSTSCFQVCFQGTRREQKSPPAIFDLAETSKERN